MQNGGFSTTIAAVVYDECNLLRRGFASVEIVHCSREVNQVAYELARRAFHGEKNLVIGHMTHPFL